MLRTSRYPSLLLRRQQSKLTSRFKEYFKRVDEQKGPATVLPPPTAKLPVKKRIPRVQHVIPVASGKGGVGKSTVAVNVALALSRQRLRIGLLDADLFGPSLPLMMNLRHQQPFTTEKGALLPLQNYGLECMSMGFLVPEEKPVVWRGLMVMKALQQLLFQVEWPELDVLLIDMPPGTGDTQLTISQLVELSGAIIVSTPQDVALADARKGIAMFQKVNVPLLGLVENMSYHQCSQCGHQETLFGTRDGFEKLRKEFNSSIDLLGSIPLHARICENVDHGRPTVVSQPQSEEAKAFMAIAERVLVKLQLSQRSSDG